MNKSTCYIVIENFVVEEVEIILNLLNHLLSSDFSKNGFTCNSCNIFNWASLK